MARRHRGRLMDRSFRFLQGAAVAGADPQDPKLGLHGNGRAVEFAYAAVQWASNARYLDRDPAADDGPLPWRDARALDGMLLVCRLDGHAWFLLWCARGSCCAVGCLPRVRW